ncbi:MAG: type VII toxin-antitoxin system HepT family RNase toxin [bacterium]
MTTLAVIENKISSIRKYLGILERYTKFSQKEIEENIDLRGAVERYLYLAVQATIDLAEAVIAYKHFRKPSTFGESFHILEEKGVISSALTAELVKMTGFRNVIAHDYETLNYDIVYQILQHASDDIERFLNSISSL